MEGVCARVCVTGLSEGVQSAAQSIHQVLPEDSRRIRGRYRSEISMVRLAFARMPCRL